MVTLTKLLPEIEQLSASEKRELVRLLTEELAEPADIAPLEPGKIYDLPTPYDCSGAGAALMQALEGEERPSLAATLAGKVGVVSFEPEDLSERTSDAFSQLLNQRDRATSEDDEP